jgi:hypothetical protein
MSSFFNLLYMVSKIWMSREMIFGHKEAIILHVRNSIYEKKCIFSPIVTDSLYKNPEVGTVVSENAVLYLGVFLLNNELCAIHRASTIPWCKGKKVFLYLYYSYCKKKKG